MSTKNKSLNTNSSVITKNNDNVIKYKLYEQIKNNLGKYSFFSVLRHLERILSYETNYIPIGKSSSPEHEVVKIYQNPSLAFYFKNIDEIDFTDNKIQLAINEVGLLGPNTPLPAHLIEYIYQRHHHFGDKSWTAFINMLQQRILTTFFRGWVNAQSVISLENNTSDKFSRYISSIVGLAGLNKETEHQYVNYYSKLYYSGYYLFRNHSKVSFESILMQYFHLPFKIKENMGRWLDLPISEQTQLSSNSKYTLGDGLIIGSRVFDSQTKFRIVIGPMNLKECESFFRDEFNAKRMCEWVKLYFGEEFDWDVQLLLAEKSVPLTILGGKNRLGLTTYLGKVRSDVGDIIIKY